MKHKLAELVAFFILIFGICAIILLTGAISTKSINGWWYLLWMVVTATVMSLDVDWIDKHFVDGEWI